MSSAHEQHLNCLCMSVACNKADNEMVFPPSTKLPHNSLQPTHPKPKNSPVFTWHMNVSTSANFLSLLMAGRPQHSASTLPNA